jgi:hypothetical protein
MAPTAVDHDGAVPDGHVAPVNVGVYDPVPPCSRTTMHDTEVPAAATAGIVNSHEAVSVTSLTLETDGSGRI